MQNAYSNNKRTSNIYTRYKNTLKKEGENMKNEIRRTVDKILKVDAHAREDDNYLILCVVEELAPDIAKMRF